MLAFFSHVEAQPELNVEADDAASAAAAEEAAATEATERRIEAAFLRVGGERTVLLRELCNKPDDARARRRTERKAVLRQLRGIACQRVGKSSYAVRRRRVLLGTFSTLRRVKLLQFYEDHRPAYYGTRRRRRTGGAGKTGRTPVNSVGTLSGVDYEVDSEEEWEEGAEEGESLSGSEGEDEGADGRELDDGDGWLCDDELNTEGGKRKRIKAGGPRAAVKVIVGPLRLLTDGALCMANGLVVDVAAVEAEKASGETKEIVAPVVEEASFGGGNIGASLMHTSSSSSLSSLSSSSSSSSSASSSSAASSSSSSSLSSRKRARTGEAGPVKHSPMLRGVDGLAGAARLFQQYAAVALMGDGQAPLQVLHRAELHDDATFAQRMMESRGTKRGGDDKRGVGAAKKVVPPELKKVDASRAAERIATNKTTNAGLSLLSWLGCKPRF